MSDPVINGQPGPNPLEQANIRFAKAFFRFKAPDGRLQLNPMQLLVELELLKLSLGVLIELACQHGMDATGFNAAVVTHLNAQAEVMEKTPTIAIAPAPPPRRS